MRAKFLFNLLAIGLSTIACAKARHIVFLWDGFNCTGNDKYIRNVSCHINKPDHRSVTGEVTLLRSIGYSHFKGRIFLSRGIKVSKQPLFEFDLNSCKFMSGSLQNVFLQIFRAVFEKYSNLPRKCPLYKGETYFVKNFTVDANFVPEFIPEATFHCMLDLYIPGKGSVYSAQTRGHMVEINNL